MTEGRNEEQILDAALWEPIQINGKEIDGHRHPKLLVKQRGDELVFYNNTNEKARYRFTLVVPPIKPESECVTVKTTGYAAKGTGCLWIGKRSLPLTGTTLIPCNAKTKFRITFECSAHSEISISQCDFAWHEEMQDLTDACNESAEVLVIVPDYPSDANLYVCAFAHSRNRRYIQCGLKVQVANIRLSNNYQSQYELDGVPVLTGGVADLKKLISKKQYKVLVTHFVEGFHYRIFDGYVTNEQLVFICHGPETVYNYLRNVTRPYFCTPLPEVDVRPDNTEAIKRYSAMDNVHWVFVSEWLMQKSMQEQNVAFKNCSCIYNTIDGDLFPYREKDEESRKRILMLRKFDNNRNHSVDIAIECILELSRRPFFSDLEIDIIGDGYYFDVFVEPVKGIPNVSITRTFVANEKIADLHAEHGIILIPSRHDAHAVSMSEAASSGLVVVGSQVTSNPFFFDDEQNHTLAPAEDPFALADIIERLYNDPQEFKAISKRMSNRIRSMCSVEQTADKEIVLIRDRLALANAAWHSIPVVGLKKDPVLTITVPAYNLQDYLSKCLFSLLRCRNASKLEILIINDGSSDETSSVAQAFEEANPGIIRVFNKENGGHGSTINLGIKEARGKYFRIIDGDDWVMTEALDDFIDILENEQADVVLTKGAYEKLDEPGFAPLLEYPMIDYGRLYYFDDLLFPIYGFDTYGPMLPNSTYKTKLLQDAGFSLSEHTPYVDMEFNAFSLRYVKTLSYYNLDIYRYYIGREGQSISRDAWKRHYNKHRHVILNIIETIENWDGYPESKKRYVREHIIGPMVDTQVFMYDQIGKLDELDSFLEALSLHPLFEEAALVYIDKHSPGSKAILNNYRFILANGYSGQPIINQQGKASLPKKHKNQVRSLAKAFIPYGLIEKRQKKRKKKHAEEKRKADERKAWGL